MLSLLPYNFMITTREAIVQETMNLLHNPSEYLQMSQAHNPHGDGQAAGRIVQTVLAVLGK